MLSEEELRAIEERANEATPGKWRRLPHFPREGFGIESVTPGGYCLDVVAPGIHEDGNSLGVIMEEDAEFIAHARQDVPDLLAEVERLRLEDAKLRVQVAGLQGLLNAKTAVSFYMDTERIPPEGGKEVRK